MDTVGAVADDAPTLAAMIHAGDLDAAALWLATAADIVASTVAMKRRLALASDDQPLSCLLDDATQTTAPVAAEDIRERLTLLDDETPLVTSLLRPAPAPVMPASQPGATTPVEVTVPPMPDGSPKTKEPASPKDTKPEKKEAKPKAKPRNEAVAATPSLAAFGFTQKAAQKVVAPKGGAGPLFAPFEAADRRTSARWATRSTHGRPLRRSNFCGASVDTAATGAPSTFCPEVILCTAHSEDYLRGEHRAAFLGTHSSSPAVALGLGRARADAAVPDVEYDDNSADEWADDGDDATCLDSLSDISDDTVVSDIVEDDAVSFADSEEAFENNERVTEEREFERKLRDSAAAKVCAPVFDVALAQHPHRHSDRVLLRHDGLTRQNHFGFEDFAAYLGDPAPKVRPRATVQLPETVVVDVKRHVVRFPSLSLNDVLEHFKDKDKSAVRRVVLAHFEKKGKVWAARDPKRQRDATTATPAPPTKAANPLQASGPPAEDTPAVPSTAVPPLPAVPEAPAP